MGQVSRLNKCSVFGCAKCPGKSPSSLIRWECTHPCHAGGGQEDVSAYNNRLRREFFTPNGKTETSPEQV